MQQSHSPEASAPLHSILWSLGKSLFNNNKISQLPAGYFSHPALEDKVQALTMQQLSIALRMSGMDGEEETMLTSLEGMVLAGEISFADFIGRISHLFPHKLDALDVSLRMKVAVQLLPRD